jgi:D-3-phosphoglycerate dehydrogenase
MKILVADKLDARGLEILNNAKGLEVDNKPGLSPEDLKAIIGQYEGLIVRSATKVPADLIAAAGRLKVIGRAGIGVDTVDVDAASKRGIVVMNTPLANTITTAEHAVSMMLALARKIPQAHATMKAGQWEKKKFTGVEVYQKTLGVIGLGNIGKIVARRAIGLEMKVIAYDPFITREKAEELGVGLVGLEELLSRADFISVHVPKTKDTTNLINRDAFAKMKKGVRIVNCARGGIVNETDLVEAIKSGKVAGAACDVFDKEPIEPSNPLIALDEVIMTPHLGAATTEAQENVSTAIAEQMVDFAAGIIANAVNMPSLDPEVMAKLKPYLGLAEKMGLFLGQMMDSGLKEVRLSFCGEVAGLDTRPLSMTFMKGILYPQLQEMVNLVNAPFLARERGVKVSETKREECDDFLSSLEAVMVTETGETSIVGTIFSGGHARIVSLNGFDLEVEPEGDMLVFSNHDEPGVIGKVGTLLGDSKVNIAGFHLGRKVKEAEAVAIVTIDSPVPEKVLTMLRALPFIRFAKQVKL